MAGPQAKIEVLVDSREQHPWNFPESNFITTRQTLRTGDYTIRGLEDRIVIERKELGDFVNTVIREWLRFRKELYRMASFDVAAIVVEANLEQIVEHRYESEASPASVLGRMHGIFLDHGIPVFLWGDRVLAAEMAARFLLQAWRKLT